MKVLSAKNPRWADSERKAILITTYFDAFPNGIEFAAMPSDVEPHGRELFARIINGEFGEIAEPAFVADLEQEKKTLINIVGRLAEGKRNAMPQDILDMTDDLAEETWHKRIKAIETERLRVLREIAKAKTVQEARAAITSWRVP